MTVAFCPKLPKIDPLDKKKIDIVGAPILEKCYTDGKVMEANCQHSIAVTRLDTKFVGE